jgi:hypothetical protein
MNERIEKLVRQAGMVKILEEHAHEYGNGTFENTPYPELEKFAELIIRECTGLIDSMDHSSQYFPHVADTIKQHFGVEE